MLEAPFTYNEDKQQERCYWRRVGFAAFFALAIILIVVPMFGCASAEQKAEEPKVCYLGLLGQTEEGYTVVAQQCMTPEAFKAQQKK